MPVYQQNTDGSWSPAEPIGWREEHNPVQRLILWLLRRPHCNDNEKPGPRKPPDRSWVKSVPLKDAHKEAR